MANQPSDRLAGAGLGKVLIAQSREAPDHLYDIYESTAGITEIYADGQINLMVGTSTSKISFYTTTGLQDSDKGPIERREIVARMVIPTVALVEFCTLFLKGLASNERKFTEALDTERAKILSRLGTKVEEKK